MQFTALTLEGERDAGGCHITSFAIPLGREAEAGHELLICLSEAMEVCLRNDLDDEGGEGCTFFRKTESEIFTMVGGHGWQGRWSTIQEADVLAAVAELAPLNRGGQWGRASLSRDK